MVGRGWWPREEEGRDRVGMDWREKIREGRVVVVGVR